MKENYISIMTSKKEIIATDRSRARRCVEACVFVSIDFVGYPRFGGGFVFIGDVFYFYVIMFLFYMLCVIM
ncbi:hypothetical protein, partial [Bifidobacterium longum]|uniref:hypothetical protein n=1 Tax=Bifidobacterium longum TaxID=216816 RepID=UPI003D00D585